MITLVSWVDDRVLLSDYLGVLGGLYVVVLSDYLGVLGGLYGCC